MCCQSHPKPKRPTTDMEYLRAFLECMEKIYQTLHKTIRYDHVCLTAFLECSRHMAKWITYLLTSAT